MFDRADNFFPGYPSNLTSIWSIPPKDFSPYTFKFVDYLFRSLESGEKLNTRLPRTNLIRVRRRLLERIFDFHLERRLWNRSMRGFQFNERRVTPTWNQSWSFKLLKVRDDVVTKHVPILSNELESEPVQTGSFVTTTIPNHILDFFKRKWLIKNRNLINGKLREKVVWEFSLEVFSSLNFSS